MLSEFFSSRFLELTHPLEVHWCQSLLSQETPRHVGKQYEPRMF